ncbi:MAG: hypothetical protein QXS20_09200 [Candidatus Thorarchaeota archaeon]
MLIVAIASGEGPVSRHCAAFAVLSARSVFADCDLDAPESDLTALLREMWDDVLKRVPADSWFAFP